MNSPGPGYPYPPGYGYGGPGIPCPPVPPLIAWLQHFGTQIDTHERVVEAEAQPFAQRWILAEQVFAAEKAELIPRNNAIIHPGNSPNAERFEDRNLRFSLVIQPSEVIYDPLNPPAVPSPAGPGIPMGTFNPYAAALNLGMPSSMLKVRITLALGFSREIFFDVDVGAGVLIPLETRWVNKVEVLIPDPTSVPATLPAPPLALRMLATMFRSRIICCDCVPPVPILSPTYSQLFFQAGDDGVLMPRVAFAQEAQVQLDANFGAGDNALFVQVRDTPFAAQSQEPLPTTLTVGSLETTAAQNNTLATQFPGQANAVVVNATGRIINVIQTILPP